MAKIDSVERRLLNWARWKLGANHNQLGYASPSLSERVDGGGGYRSAAIPTLEHDACETDAAIATLPKDTQLALYEVYVCESPSSVLEQRLGVGYRAVMARIETAYRALLRVFEDNQAALRAAREATIERQARAK